MFSPAIERSLGLHEALRRLGFTPDEIFVAHNGGEQPAVVLCVDGRSKFAISVGHPYSDGEQVYLVEWGRAVAWWNEAADEANRQRMFEEAVGSGAGLDLVLRLNDKGLLPRPKG